MGLFGKIPVGVAQAASTMGQKKPGGGLFGADSALWKIMGGAGDVIAGDNTYTSGLMQSEGLRQRAIMEQAQREAENNQWYERERWKRENPEPRVNDTVADFNWYKGLSEPDRGLYDQMKPVTVMGPDGPYLVPRSSMGGGYAPQAPVAPSGGLPQGYTKRSKGGPASAPGGFPQRYR